MKNIMVVCGNGLGTSLMMEMAVKEVLQKLGKDAQVSHEDLSSAISSQADIWVAAKDVAKQLEEAGKQNIVSLTNIFDKADIQAQLTALL